MLWLLGSLALFKKKFCCHNNMPGGIQFFGPYFAKGLWLPNWGKITLTGGKQLLQMWLPTNNQLMHNNIIVITSHLKPFASSIEWELSQQPIYYIQLLVGEQEWGKVHENNQQIAIMIMITSHLKPFPSMLNGIYQPNLLHTATGWWARMRKGELKIADW